MGIQWDIEWETVIVYKMYSKFRFNKIFDVIEIMCVCVYVKAYMYIERQRNLAIVKGPHSLSASWNHQREFWKKRRSNISHQIPNTMIYI